MKFLGALIAVSVSFGSFAHASAEFASEADRANYFAIESIEVRQDEMDADTAKAIEVFYNDLTTTTRPMPQMPAPVQQPQVPQLPRNPNAPVTLPPVGLPPVGGTGGITDPLGIQQWITVGERVWQLIANNRPTANITTNRVSVLPTAQQDWAQIENWQGPAAYTVTVEAKNGFGSVVVRNKYTIAWNYGGQYNNTGAYIGNLTMIPTDISVSFGYTMNSRVVVGDAVNVATAKSPVPALSFQVESSITNIMKHIQQTESFFITGKGDFKKIN